MTIMRIGIPKEIKDHEFRVAATPAGVALLVQAGQEVRVQTGAGTAIGYPDEAYRAAGASIVGTATEAFDVDLVYKVKEPQTEELALLRSGQILFCYLHLAAVPDLAKGLLARNVTAIAFETVEDQHGGTPLLAPMSQVAGRLAIQAGMRGLEMAHGGRGVLLPGVPGVPPGRVTIIGGGQVGANAARVAVGAGAQVTLLERSMARLQYFDDLYLGRLQTRYSNAANLESCLAESDLVVGAVYLHGRRAPHLIDRAMLRKMPSGAVIVDVAIDQGGIAETSRPTTHSHPFFIEEGIVHYCVANMPAAVARTSTQALAEATLPYLLRLTELGPAAAFQQDPGFASGLNLAFGRIAHPGLALDLGMDAMAWSAFPWSQH